MVRLKGNILKRHHGDGKDFNSSMVRLKENFFTDATKWIDDFNSSMVRLKADRNVVG